LLTEALRALLLLAREAARKPVLQHISRSAP